MTGGVRGRSATESGSQLDVRTGEPAQKTAVRASVEGKTVQARVDGDTARKFSAIARARNMTDSQLVRYAIDLMIREAAKDLDKLQEALRRDFEDAKLALSEGRF